MNKIEIPKNIIDLLINKKEHLENEIESAAVYKYGNHIKILSVVYNAYNPTEWYNIDEYCGGWQNWEEIRAKIEKAAKEFVPLDSKVTLKQEYTLSIESYEYLEKLTLEAKEHMWRIEKEFYLLATTLKNTKELFKNSKDNRSFMKWYHDQLGLSKDQVSLLLKRLHLVECFPNKNNVIAVLPQNGVKELTKKKTPESVRIATIKAFEKGEIKSESQIKKFIQEQLPIDLDDIKPIDRKIKQNAEKINTLIGRYLDRVTTLSNPESEKIDKCFNEISKILNKNKERGLTIEILEEF